MVRRYFWFAAALIAQIGILAALPLGRDESGKRIWLSAKVTNLRDVMRGSGIRLDYDVARLNVSQRRGETVYVTLRVQADSTWATERTGSEKPSEVSEGEVVIRGKTADRWVPVRVPLHRDTSGKWIAGSVVTGQEEGPPGLGDTDRTVARGSFREKYVNFGIGYYHVPERLRRQIVEDVRKHPEDFAALVQVDPNGRAALLGFRVQEREFRF